MKCHVEKNKAWSTLNKTAIQLALQHNQSIFSFEQPASHSSLIKDKSWESCLQNFHIKIFTFDQMISIDSHRSNDKVWRCAKNCAESRQEVNIDIHKIVVCFTIEAICKNQFQQFSMLFLHVQLPTIPFLIL